MNRHQLDLFLWSDNLRPQLLAPRDIWSLMSADLIPRIKEDRRVEFKSARNIDWEGTAEYYSMFSNTPEGGVVVFGVENDRSISGCDKVHQNILNRMETFHRQYCPLSKPEFRRVPVSDGADFLVAVFLPYVGVLVETNKQEAFIRYGDQKVRMSEPEKSDFRATRSELSFEMQPAALSFPADFDMPIINEFHKQFCEREGRENWSVEALLEDRFLGKRTPGAFQANNALVLLAAKQPQSIIPGCRVRIQRFADETEGTGADYKPLKDQYLEGNLVRIMQMASHIIPNLTYDVTWLSRDGKFVTTPEYPYMACFEAFVNACVHRSYSFSGTEVTVKFFSDRLEIESPGGFVPPVNEQNIYHVRAARNPHMMDALRYLGYVQMAREGVKRMRDSMMDADLPEPIFRQESVHGVMVRVTLRNDYETRKRTTNREVAQFFGVDTWRTLQEHEIKILAWAFRNKTINVSEAQRLTGRTWATSKKDLDRMARRNLLKFEPGSYQRDSKAHYKVISNGETKEVSG